MERRRHPLSSVQKSLSRTPMRDLRQTMAEMKKLNVSRAATSNGLSAPPPTPSSAGSNPSSHLRRHETSPAIMELPPITSAAYSPTDSLEEGPHAIITSPGISESFPEEDNPGLMSPNLVNTTGLSPASLPGLGSKLNNLAQAGNMFAATHEERKALMKARLEASTPGGGKALISADKAAGLKHNTKRFMAGDMLHEESNLASVAGAKISAYGSAGDNSFAETSNHMRASSHSSRSISGTSGATGGSGSALARSNGANFFHLHHTSQSSSSSSSKKFGLTNGRHHANTAAAKAAAAAAAAHQFTLLSARQLVEKLNSSMTIEELKVGLRHFDDLECLTPSSNVKSVESTLVKYSSILASTVEAMKKHEKDEDACAEWMSKINDMMTKAWEVPAHGHEIGVRLCDILRSNGGLDLLIENCASSNENLRFNSARLLQQCLVTENRGYVVEKGLDKVVEVAKNYASDICDAEKSRVGTGILEHLFKHNEMTCADVIEMGGLDSVVNECKSTDVATLRHCASALANVAMCGGADNQEEMMRRKVASWLFPLAFHTDDTVKYYACLAIAALVANKEIEAEVKKSGTLELIEPFVQTHTPKAVAETSATHSHGQSSNWLRRLVPVLASQREEARNLAAFHFCVEAEIKLMQQRNVDLFAEIGAIDALKKLASSPNGLASKYAVQTLRLLGEEVPHKLSQQVPTWSVEDVQQWVKQIGFPQFAASFVESRVDGDLLLQLTEDMLREDIKMTNGILRRRFLRDLTELKRKADYSNCDLSGINDFLQSLGAEYSNYTYALIQHGVDKETLMGVNEEAVLSECGIVNKIHRMKILQGIKVERGEFKDDESNIDKNLDVFISYRRSNGSQLASLLKVHLEIRNFSVFLDVDRLEAGKFDNNLLQSIRSAKNFVLVLTPGALDRCFDDSEQRDWIHKEVFCALQSQCNIIPVFDNFVMPDSAQLPETMRAITSYNGVKWIHDYQEACVDKIDRFIRGDGSNYIIDRYLSSQQSTSYMSGYGTWNSQNRPGAYMRTVSGGDHSSCSEDVTSERETQRRQHRHSD